MSLTFLGENCEPSYLALSTDIANSKIEGAVLVGKKIYITNTNTWYIINSDLTLKLYELPITLSGSVSVGNVGQGNAGVDPWLVKAEGYGTPGTPDGGVMTVQGDPVGEPVLTNSYQPLDEVYDVSAVQPNGEVYDVSSVQPAGEIYDVSAVQPIGEIYDVSSVQPAGEIYDVDTSSTDLSIVDTNNSTSTPLGASAVFTGTFVELTKFINISIMVGSDVASATNGLVVQWSTNGTDVDDMDVFTISANSHKQFTFGVPSKYVRIIYTNGNSAQSSFRLQTMLHRSAPKPSSHRIQDNIVDEDDAELVKAVMTVKVKDGTYKNITGTQDGMLQVGINDIQADASMRVRTSSLTTLGDYKLIGFDKSLSMEGVGTGTGLWALNKFTMSVTAGQYYIRQSRRYHPYFSGKSQLVEESFDTFAPQANVVKRVGYFSSNAVAPYQSNFDGFWLESGNGTITIKASRAGVSVLSVPLASMSGYANLAEYQNPATWDNFTVIQFDFLWLGGAVFKMWIKTSLGFVVAHEFIYVGTSSDSFILSPVQPIRYEIVSTTGSGSFRQICSQVATEGSIGESGNSRFVDSGAFIALTTVGTAYPIKAIRKVSSLRDVPGTIEFTDISLLGVNDRARWTLRINPTLSAPLTYTPVSNSAKEEATGNGIITVTSPGTIIAGGSVVSNASSISPQLQLNFLAWLGGTIDNIMDSYVLCVTPLTANINVFGGIGWKEY